MNSWLKLSRSGQGEGKSPGMGPLGLESLALFSTQPAGCSSLFCISGPCFLPHTTNPKQTNLSLAFQVIAKLLFCELPTPIWVLNCTGPLLPARPLFLYRCAISLHHFPICLSLKPFIISPFHFPAEVWSKAHWNVSISFNGIWIRPNIFVSFRHP